MSTSISAPATATSAPRSTVRLGSRATAAVLAGILILTAGAVIWMGIMTAEALYPATYTTHDNEISDLGATRPPNSVIRQPSATIFNLSMIATGAAVIAGAAFIHRAYGLKSATIPILLLGIGALGVGVFPGNRAPMHGLFALLTFVSGGLSGILAVSVIEGPFRHVSRALGITALGSLVVAFAGDSTVVFRELGDGGIERWVAFPVIIWMVAFGAYQAARTAPPPPDQT